MHLLAMMAALLLGRQTSVKVYFSFPWLEI
jgi:hypothetical protein